jgi:hypothetical protein
MFIRKAPLQVFQSNERPRSGRDPVNMLQCRAIGKKSGGLQDIFFTTWPDVLNSVFFGAKYLSAEKLSSRGPGPQQREP